jgi:hypothetical protein
VKGTRILRYVGNKPTPEKSVYSSEEIWEQGWPMALMPEKELEMLRQVQQMRELELQRQMQRPGPRRLGEKVQILVTQSPIRQAIILHTNDARIPHMEIPDYAMAFDRSEPTVFIRQYIHQIVRAGFATLEEIDVQIPNFYSHQQELEKQREANLRAAMQQAIYLKQEEERKRKQKQSNPFEVNMVEALVGWKGWKIGDNNVLKSPTFENLWSPDVPFEAVCKDCLDVPHEAHSCGVYATDDLNGAKGYGVVWGQVHGWGRYIRGDKGWRSQFAYPKAFYLNEDQGHLVEILRAYHVPVYVKQPMLIYNPEEDGYDGHWNAEADGNCGAHQVSDAGEAGSAGEED